MAGEAATTTQILERRTPEGVGDSHLVALHQVFQTVARQADPQNSLTLIAEKARSLTGATTAAVMLLNDARTTLDFAAVAGADAEQILGQAVRVEDALAGQTALTGEPYLVHDPAAPRPLDPGLTRGWGVRSAAVVPIYLSGRPAGSLAAINREDDDAFSGSDVLRLQVLANAAALALGAEALRGAAARKQRERDILFEAARAASSSLNVQEVLRSVLATVADSMEMTSGAVFLLNDERSRLYVGAHWGLGDEDLDRQLAADFGLAAQMLSSSQPTRLADLAQSEWAEDAPLPGARALLAAPMASRTGAEGLIVICSRQAGAYTPEDAHLLLAVASQAAVALENAWLYEDATRRAEEATAIYELSQAVGATLHLDRVLQFVADSVLNLLHVDKFALFLFDPRAQALEIKIARSLRRETVQAMRPRVGEGIAGWVMEFETPTAVQDVAADRRNRSCPIDTEGVESLVSVPLQSGDRVIGVLHAMSSRRRLFTVGEMELLYTIANQAGAAIANAQMYEEARQKSDEIRKYVRRVARALGSSLAPQETAQTIADLSLEMTDADRAVLLSLDDQEILTPRAAANFRSALAQGPQTVRTAESAAAWVARHRRSLVIEDWSRETRFPMPPFAARERVAGYLGVPLKLGKTSVGVLEIYTKDARRFSADEVRLLLTFASQAAVGWQNALLVEQAGRRVTDLQTVGAVAAHLAGAARPEDIYPELLSLLGAALRADAGLLRLSEPAPAEYLYGPSLELHALLRGQAAAVPPEAEAAGAFFLAVPLRVAPEATPFGVLALARTLRQPDFDTQDRQLALTAVQLLSARLRT